MFQLHSGRAGVINGVKLQEEPSNCHARTEGLGSFSYRLWVSLRTEAFVRENSREARIV
jgi:hypothetical protein